MKLIKLHNISWEHMDADTVTSMEWEMDYTNNFEEFSNELSMILQFMSEDETKDNKIIGFDIRVIWTSEEELRNKTK